MDKKTIQAIKASIRHWEKDILKPLQVGHKIKIVPNLAYWESDNILIWDNDRKRKVKCFSEHCPLCWQFSNNECFECPLGSCRQGSKWYKFFTKPNITTARAMIRKLKSLLPKEERNG